MLDFLDGRMPLVPFADLGMNMVHVEDVAAGILLALDKGRVGESYVLGDQITTMRGPARDATAEVAGKRPPRANLPTGLMKVDRAARAGHRPADGPAAELPRADLLRPTASRSGPSRTRPSPSSASSPRGLETGLRQTFEAEGSLPAKT